MNSNIWLYDIEVFEFDWVVIFQCYTTGKKKIFHNENYALVEFIDDEKPVIGGYNTKHYDRWILKAIYHGADNAIVKALNDFIMEGNDGWNFPFLSYKNTPWINFDLMDDIPVPLRLKEIEGNLGMDIKESSVPFNIDRPLMEGELTETIEYCSYDVEATVALFNERKDYLESKVTVGAMRNISEAESLRMTNAKLTAEYLEAVYRDREDDLIYEFPENLKVQQYTQVLEFFEKVDPTYKRNLNIDIAGVPHTVAWGGLHGALECYHERRTDTRKVMHIDVTSYYPSLMIINGYMSRSVPDPDEYQRVYERRIAAKKAKDKATANALKLVLNTTFGAMKTGHNSKNTKVRNKLYDPKMANAVCISGQLYLIDLIEKLEPIPSFKLIQSNTDGLIVSYDIDQEKDVRTVVGEWEQRTGFKMGMEEVDCIFQKDVNNYVVRQADGSIDPDDGLKGGYVSNYNGGDFKSKSYVVVDKAIVAYLLDNIPPEVTINSCDDLMDFQIIAKAGSTYDKVIWVNAGKEIEVQNVNRVFASINKDSGTLYKIKLPKKEGDPGRRDKIANIPDHCFIANIKGHSINMVDKQFYIDLAQKRINDYLGIEVEKPKKQKSKGEKKKMAARTKPETPTQEAVQQITGLAAKLMKLREVMNTFAWEKDGINRRQSYEYITEKQYKNNFKAALAAAGLDFKSSMLEYQFIESISDKMNMVIGRFEFQIIDRDTGEGESYPAFGAGADMGDKGLYKAYTGAIKYFIANNFLVAEGSDPESDETETRQDKPHYTPPEKREEIKKKVVNQEEPATEEQLEAIALGISMLEEAKIDADIVAAFTELLSTELTKAAAEETIDAIQTLLPEDAA